MIIQKTDNMKLVKGLITNPKFEDMVFTKEELHNFNVDTSCDYLLVIHKTSIIGCIQIKPFTKTILEFHMFILPDKTLDHYNDLAHVFSTYAKKQGYLKLYTKIPGTAIHALKAAQKQGLTSCGMIEKGIVYRNILTTLFFFEYDLYRHQE